MIVAADLQVGLRRADKPLSLTTQPKIRIGIALLINESEAGRA